MTPHDLPAGRELDALIAEKVMAWTPVTHWHGSPIDERWLGFWDGEWFRWVIRPIDEDEEGAKPLLWNPSTDIAAAWMVVEKLGNWHGFDFMIELESDATNLVYPGQWHAGWFEGGYEGPESRESAYALTAPLAICRAALAACKEAS